MKKLMFALMAAASLCGIQTFAQEATETPALEASEKCPFIPSVSINVDYKSRYMSDGNVVNPDSMIMMDGTLSWDITDNAGFYLGSWAAFDINDYNDINGDAEEVDYFGGAWYTIGDLPVVKSLTFDASLTRWYYPKRLGWDVVGDTQYVADLAISTGAFNPCEKFSITPNFKIRNDFENGEWQLKPGVSTSYALTERISLNNSLDLFWQNAKYTAGRSNVRAARAAGIALTGHDGIYRNGFTNLVLNTSVSFMINDHFSIAPFWTCAFAVDGSYRDSWKAEDSANSKNGFNNCWGVRLSANF